ncbi:YhgE/Pip domain-containing protein [uncultured Tyzzerella sp.]|uniref:YhgE/Pip domain-containing protein n=1 Tax=uncultured Tyzzerella sp. TaxID=2321398 RepID=UPI002941E49B|nr:YhgE/Pip domain-containing protein [uncultured Tyzzerella sp.]
MKNIFRITYRDFKKIIKNPVALTVIIGACFIPALYAWFNIAASWDPYGSTNGLKVAVSNNDTGTQLLDIDLNLGDKIKEELQGNNNIGWVFVDKDIAIEGVKSGEYYAGVIIPENFSENFSSILTDDIKTPKIEYYVNQKKNAIAPKITDKGVSVVQQQINEAFLDTASKVLEGTLKVAYNKIDEKEQTVADNMISALNQVSSSLEQYKNLSKSFDEGLNSTKSLIDTTKLILPAGKSIAQNGEDMSNNINGLIHSSSQVFNSITGTVESFLLTSEDLANDILDVWKDVSNVNEDNIDIIKMQIDFINKRTDKIITINKNIDRVLNNLNNKLPIRLKIIDEFVNKLERLNGALNDIISTGENIERIINSGNNISDSLRKSMGSQLNKVREDISGIKDLYRANIKPNIDYEAEKMYKTLVDFNILSKNTMGIISQMDKILDGIFNTIEASQKAIESTNNVIQSSQDDVKNLQKKIQEVKAEDKLKKLATILKNDPNTVGKFISAPVQVEQVSFYEISNYGSAMTPFYTILSFWVGGVLLVSLLKTRVYEDDNIKNIKPYQAYIGRYFLFMIIGIIQAIVVCLGDLYILKVQCLNPVLFVLAGIVASIVFINIIYTLVVSFGDVGKAICVFLLVIQVAGAGGTFPVEVTPEFFQKINPYIPFTYGINAMRETIAGIYENAYKTDIIKLLSFLPFSLLLGLFLRKPLIKINEFFEEKLEETHLM